MENIFLIILGAILMTLGSRALRLNTKLRLGKGVWPGKVLSVDHVEKKDEDGIIVTDYYELKVEFQNGKAFEKKTLRTGEPYYEGETAYIFRNLQNNGYSIMKDKATSLPFSIFLLLAGIAVIMIPVIRMNYNPDYINILLTIIFYLFAGLLLILYARDRKKVLTPLDSEITDITKAVTGQAKKYRAAATSYYPVVTYTLNGEKRRQRLKRNANSKDTFKIGRKIKIYYNENTRQIEETGPRISFLILGILLLLFALVGTYASIQLFL